MFVIEKLHTLYLYLNKPML